MKFKVGDRVKYVGGMHEVWPLLYPDAGTCGTVKDKDGEGVSLVLWDGDLGARWAADFELAKEGC